MHQASQMMSATEAGKDGAALQFKLTFDALPHGFHTKSSLTAASSCSEPLPSHFSHQSVQPPVKGNNALHESTEESAQQRLTNYLTRQHEKMNNASRNIRLLRSSVKISWERFYRFRKDYHQSRIDFDEAMDPITTQYSVPDAFMDNMNALRRTLGDNRTQLEAQYQEAKNLERNLKIEEERLERKQGGFTQAAIKLMALIAGDSAEGLFADLASETEFHGSSVSADSSAESIDPRVQRYYERISDMKVQSDRLRELSIQHQEARTAREHRRDQDAVMGAQEDDFEADYERQRQRIEQELDYAAADADRHRHECEEAGLDIAAHAHSSTAVLEESAPPTSYYNTTHHESTVRDLRVGSDGVPDMLEEHYRVVVNAANINESILRERSPDTQASTHHHSSITSWVESIEMPPSELVNDPHHFSDSTEPPSTDLSGSNFMPKEIDFTTQHMLRATSGINLQELSPLTGSRQEVIDHLKWKDA